MPHDSQQAALQEAFEERAAILEFDAHLTREEAERKAAMMVYGTTKLRLPAQ